MILAGDIGGTKTILALFAPAAGPHHPLMTATYPSGRYASLEAIIQEFLLAHPATLTAACFGVAGPVVQGRATITNLPWLLDAATISDTLNIPRVTLINDLEAIAHAVPILEADDIAILSPGAVVLGGTIAVIAPGTGLGEAFLAWDGQNYQPYPSEGGHASFAPNGPTERALLAYLAERLGHVSVERVCSGLGIPNIYAYFRDCVFDHETPAVAAQLADGGDPTPIIVGAALDPNQSCPLCQATVESFISILGAEAGNLALKVLATGGVYLGGGIPPRLLGQMRHERFLTAFHGKGRMSSLLTQMQIAVICNPQAALLGAAARAFH